MREPVPVAIYDAQVSAADSRHTPLAAESPHEPQLHVGWSFIAVYALAYAGIWLALLTPILVTIALKIRELAPTGGAAAQSLVLGVGAMFALIGNPLFGWLSDRTTTPWGMRRPWLLGGMLAGVAALLTIALAPSVAVVLLGWCLAQLAFNAVLAAFVAVLPDQVPPLQRGTVSGVLGICMPIGQVLGTYLVQAAAGSMLLMFMIPAAIGLLTVVVLVLMLPDRRRPACVSVRRPWGETLRAAWIDPRVHRDFAWAWLSRFLFVTGTAYLTTYQTYFLTDQLGFATERIASLIFKATLAQAVVVVISSVISGAISDALARRKLFVVAASAIYGIGLWTIAAADNYMMFLAGMVITGIGHGTYYAVDLAMVTQILPNGGRDAAKDLGIFNIANALPQSVAPAVATLVLLLSDGNYAALFAVAGASAFLGALSVLQLRTVA